ncbi:hypothetical protein B0H65DRAFT_587065, partial [Neurospora tetraspora]
MMYRPLAFRFLRAGNIHGSRASEPALIPPPLIAGQPADRAMADAPPASEPRAEAQLLKGQLMTRGIKRGRGRPRKVLTGDRTVRPLDDGPITSYLTQDT